MTSLRNHQSNSFTKLLLIGDAKSGKTGSLVSLVKAGYKLRILDLDNLLDILKYKVLEECPELIDSVESRSLRDKYKVGGTGMTIDGKPKAWTESLKLLNNWKYTDDDGTEIDLGDPHTWGPDCILVIDSLSRWCDAAYNFHEVMTPGGSKGQDGRAVYGNAQDDVEKQLATLTSKSCATNLIIIAHGQYMDMADGTKKIFPQGVGQKLSPKIPQYFPNYVRYKNSSGKRTIQLESDAMVDLANTNPGKLSKSLPIETGLAEFFAVLRDNPAKDTVDTTVRPKTVTLKRV